MIVEFVCNYAAVFPISYADKQQPFSWHFHLLLGTLSFFTCLKLWHKHGNNEDNFHGNIVITIGKIGHFFSILRKFSVLSLDSFFFF